MEGNLLGGQVGDVICTWAVQEQCEATRTKQNKTREIEEPIKTECFRIETQGHGHNANITHLLRYERQMVFFCCGLSPCNLEMRLDNVT